MKEFPNPAHQLVCARRAQRSLLSLGARVHYCSRTPFSGCGVCATPALRESRIVRRVSRLTTGFNRAPNVCPLHLRLCLGNQKLIEANLIRTPGANDLAWLDELVG